MNVRDVQDLLWAQMIKHEWFSDKILLSPNSHNTLIVYVDTMSTDILNSVPTTFYGYDVRVHYIGSISDRYAAKLPNPLADLFGKWPGDETDEEIFAALSRE